MDSQNMDCCMVKFIKILRTVLITCLLFILCVCIGLIICGYLYAQASKGWCDCNQDWDGVRTLLNRSEIWVLKSSNAVKTFLWLNSAQVNEGSPGREIRAFLRLESCENFRKKDVNMADLGIFILNRLSCRGRSRAKLLLKLNFDHRTSNASLRMKSGG